MSQIEHKYTINGPKKVLQIYDAAFALPDDFNGNIQDAMKLFLEYHEKVISEIRKKKLLINLDYLLHWESFLLAKEILSAVLRLRFMN